MDKLLRVLPELVTGGSTASQDLRSAPAGFLGLQNCDRQIGGETTAGLYFNQPETTVREIWSGFGKGRGAAGQCYGFVTAPAHSRKSGVRPLRSAYMGDLHWCGDCRVKSGSTGSKNAGVAC